MSRLGPFEENTIVIGDCLDIMAQMPDGCVDLVVTDPPYGVDYAGWDRPLEITAIEELLRICKATVMMFGAASIKAMQNMIAMKPDRCLIWAPSFTLSHTMANGIAFRWHPIWVWRPPIKFKGLPWDVLKELCSGHSEYYHPAMKPESLIQRLVCSTKGNLIFDPFMGSGTTAVVADRLGRKFFGCDINPDYVEMALERLEKDRGRRQLNLL